MKKLFDHQISGVAFLKEKKRAILADEMGLGKTKQAIHAAVEQPVLIVCPASLRLNWKREIEDVYPDHNVVVLRTKSDGEEKARWYIVNYDILYKWVEWAKNMNFPTTILDEAHYIKSKSKRSEQALELVKDIPNVYLLTGTPILNRPIEMFNMLKAIKHPLGKLRTTFARRYCGGQMKTLVRDILNGRSFFVDPKRSFPYRAKKEQYRVFTFLDDTGATHLDELRSFTSDVILRREKKDTLDLPEKIITTTLYELIPEQRRAYEAAWDEYLLWLETHPDVSRDIENIKSAQQLVELMKLKQVCS